MSAVVTVIRRAARFPVVARLSFTVCPFITLRSGACRERHEFVRNEGAWQARGWPASGLRSSWFARCHKGPPAVDGDDDSALAQQRHCVPHRGIRDPVFLGEAPLAGEFTRDLAPGDPPLYVVRYLDIGIFSPKG